MKAQFEKIIPSEPHSFFIRQVDDAAFPFNWHFHPEFELVCIKKSIGTVFVGDTVTGYRDGEVLLIGPNLPHCWFAEKSRRGRHQASLIQFSGRIIPDAVLDLKEMARVRNALKASGLGLRILGTSKRVVGEMIQALSQRSGFPCYTGLLEVLNRMGESRNKQILASPSFNPGLNKRIQNRMDRVSHYVTRHFLDQITLDEIASVVHMSPPAFSRFFKSTTGKTFTDYVNGLRVGHACMRMIETDRTIAQIALESGFPNLSNFNAQFKRIKSMTPREYRASFK